MIKELIYLIKLLFSPLTDQIEVVKMKYFPFKGSSAMSWCGKIITKVDKLPQKILNHESIHLQQALEIAKIKKSTSWISYYVEYFKYWIKGNPFICPIKSAYYTIPFEMEAYAKELKNGYKVSPNSWKKYELKDRKKTYKENKMYWKWFCRNL